MQLHRPDKNSHAEKNIGGSNVYLLFYETPYNPFFNLALEEALVMHSGCSGSIYFRLWRNRQAVIVGRSWTISLGGVNLEALHQDNVPLIRRISGGGAVYHDLGNLNYSIMLPWRSSPFKGVEYAYRRLIHVLTKALKSLGFDARIANESDIVVKGFKVSGNSVAVKWRALLLHGTLLIDADIRRLKRYTLPPKHVPKNIDPVKYRPANLSDIAGYKIPLEKIVDAIIDAVENVLGKPVKPMLPPQNVIVAAHVLEEKYRNPDWNLKGRTSLFKSIESSALRIACPLQALPESSQTSS